MAKSLTPVDGMTDTDTGVDVLQSFEVLVRPAREEVRLRAIGELDLAAGPRLRGPAEELLAAGFEQLIIDLRAVTFLDVSAVRLLLELADRAQEDGWRLSLIHGGAQPHRVFDLTETLDRLPFVDDSRCGI